MPAPTTTELSLLERARTRDAVAWQRLVELYGPLVYYWCRPLGLPQHDLADIFQEVFLSVAQALPTFKRDRPGDSFRGWLLQIVKNKARDYFRRRHGPAAEGGSIAYQRLLAIVSPAGGAADGTATDASQPDSRHGLAHRALAFLRSEFSETVWKAFWRTTVDERNSTDVAAELGISPVAVRKAKARVLRRLRQEFGDILT